MRRDQMPFVGIPADRRELGACPYHCVAEEYLVAVSQVARAHPVIIPALGSELELGLLLERLDAILLTGSPSNVDPRHYKGPSSAPGTWHDPDRDATNLPLIPLAVRAGLPILAVCRGFQEMNVAFGGTLHQDVTQIPGLGNHQSNPSRPREMQYEPLHEVQLISGGILHRLAGRERVDVNSLHTQGIDRLAPALLVEGHSPDGLVEAFQVRDAPAFAVGVQWHPEWQVTSIPFSRALFEEFGSAARARAAQRGRYA
jgi:putative glutamine amidotransferase